jgi:outer membrane receptor protein involved in Fe transport
MRFRYIFLIGFVLLAGWAAEAGAEYPESKQEDTMLMFVGEDLEILSIASRREESAWQAPAVARVITRDMLLESGAKTLGQALSMTPGFYMARREWGTLSYLRGIPNSALFLYDTVPMGSDVSQSFYPLEHDLSLGGVKRVEIIRGPGSVLWGPDAFAGIVNVVPMTGKDLEGTEVGILSGGPDEPAGFYVNHGHNAGAWDLLLSASTRREQEDDTSANVVSFWGDGGKPVPPAERYGEDEPDHSRYHEASARFSYRDWLSLSGRIAGSKRPYAVSGPENTYTWLENRDISSGFLKLEAKKDLDFSSALRFTGTFSMLHPETEVIDMSLSQEESSVYGELIYDRTLLSGTGLFTSGISYREKHIDDAPIWDSFLPDLLGPENLAFLPIITEKDYVSRLWSFFSQYTHKIGDADIWVGLRYDDHDQYADPVSYNMGTSWAITHEWMIKLILGTAYRTPAARQIEYENKPDPEEIKSINLQASWKPVKNFNLSLCGFFNRINDHTAEDYRGISFPNNQDFHGIELDLRFSPYENLDFTSNLTVFNNSGPWETYLYNDYIYIRPDGSHQKHYTVLSNPYDSGPDTLFNLTGRWRISDRISLFSRLNYASSKLLTYPGAETFESSPGEWTLDSAVTVRDLFFPGLDLFLSVKNLTDKEYDIPGSYTMIQGEPLRAEVLFRMRW